MSPQEVAEKMMAHKASSPEEWLSYLEDCGFRLSATEEKGDHEEKEEPKPGKDDKPEGPPFGDGPPRPALPFARMNAARNALKGSKK